MARRLKRVYIQEIMEKPTEDKKKRGRPEKRPDDLYSGRIQVRTTGPIKAQLEERAKTAGLTLSAYLVRKALAGRQ